MAGILWNKGYDYVTSVRLGIASDADILSVRVLGDDGTGSYEDVIEGIQYVIDTKATHNTRVINLSLSAAATMPYYADPLNRAVVMTIRCFVICASLLFAVTGRSLGQQHQVG